MPVSRMTNCLSASRPSRTISSGPALALGFVGQRDVPHLVERIGRVGDQLAERDLPALIERVRQKVENLLDLGLKRVFLAIDDSSHEFDPTKTCLRPEYRLTSRHGAWTRTLFYRTNGYYKQAAYQ